MCSTMIELNNGHIIEKEEIQCIELRINVMIKLSLHFKIFLCTWSKLLFLRNFSKLNLMKL